MSKVYFRLDMFVPDVINGGRVQFAFNSSGDSGVLGGDNAIGVFEAQTMEITRATSEKEYEFFLVWNDDINFPLLETMTNSRLVSETAIRYNIVVDGVIRVLFTGTISKFKYTAKGVYITATSFLNKLTYGKVVATSSNCRWAFGEFGCNVDTSVFQETRIINTIALDRYSFTTTVPMTANQFRDGSLTYESSDYKFDVSINSSDTILMWDEVPLVINAGDTITITQGCAKTTNACLDYNNLIRYGGIPNGLRYAPSTLKTLSGAKAIS